MAGQLGMLLLSKLHAAAAEQWLESVRAYKKGEEKYVIRSRWKKKVLTQ